MADVLAGAEASGNEAPRLPPRAARGKRQRNDRDIEHAQAARDVDRSQSSDDAGALVSMLMTDLNTAHREHMAECGVDAQVETKTSNPNDAGSETEDKEADRSSEPLGKRSQQYECTGIYCLVALCVAYALGIMLQLLMCSCSSDVTDLDHTADIQFHSCKHVCTALCSEQKALTRLRQCCL